MCAVEQESGAVARRGPQDLSVTVELGLCPCSRLPGKIDNQTDRGNTRLSQDDDMFRVLQIKCHAQVSGEREKRCEELARLLEGER